jgi:hypothetical protein
MEKEKGFMPPMENPFKKGPKLVFNDSKDEQIEFLENKIKQLEKELEVYKALLFATIKNDTKEKKEEYRHIILEGISSEDLAPEIVEMVSKKFWELI